MSIIKNDSFQTKYGEGITAAEVNTKYTDVSTAVNNLDADNVRNEGIDRENITGTPTLKAAEYTFNNIRTNKTYSFDTSSGRAGYPTAVSRHRLTGVSSGGQDVIYLTDDGTNTGTPTTIKAGDLLRIKYAFNIYATSFVTNSTNPSFADLGTLCYIIFPMYKSTSGGSYQVFPDHKNFDIYGQDGPEANESFSINVNDDGDGTNDDDGIVLVTFDGVPDALPASIAIKSMQSHGSLNFIHDADYDIHTISWFAIGPLAFTDRSPFTGGARGYITQDTASIGNTTLRVERANYAALVMQKGEG
jgi:hypothetical protein